MAITRTAKGTNTDKTGALTLSVASVNIAQNARIVVGISYDVGQGAPVITWGGDTLEDDITTVGNGIVTRISSFFHTGAADTRTVTATWTTTAPTAKSMYVIEITNVNRVERRIGTSEAATADPSSGTRSTEFYDEFYLGALGSEGPNGDTVGTVQNDYSSGQRAGTAGTPPVSNITIHEVFLISDEPRDTEAEKTGATSRDWSSALAVYRVAGTPEVADSKYMRELWTDLLDTVALVQAHGATVTIKDSADATISITDFTTLQLKKT